MAPFWETLTPADLASWSAHREAGPRRSAHGCVAGPAHVRRPGSAKPPKSQASRTRLSDGPIFSWKAETAGAP